MINIYLIQEDGQAICWQAESAHAAIGYAEDRHILEFCQDGGLELLDQGVSSESEIQTERENYRANIFESCSLVGELANPDPILAASIEVPAR